MEDPAQHVSVQSFLEVYGTAVEKAKAILGQLLKASFTNTPDDIRQALKTSILTADENLSSEQKEWLRILKA